MPETTTRKVRIWCGYCDWTMHVLGSEERVDQMAYGTINEHVNASHWAETGALRRMQIRDRRSTILGWSDLGPK